MDVGDVEQVERGVAHALAQLGRIDILVNNAGITDYAPMVDMTDEQWQRVLDVNLSGVFHCSRAVVPHMIARGGGGSIINVGSVGSYVGWKTATNYCASKAGVDLFGKTLALEVAEHGIRVNGIAPGSTDTDINAHLRDPEVRKRAAAKIPLNKVMVPEDFAGVAIFLASEASAMITGITIVQDGGWTAYLP
jgi:NAD(P)-dependent dehydrogenase (short-subunit alcohol dehydrogenase family)